MQIIPFIINAAVIGFMSLLAINMLLVVAGVVMLPIAKARQWMKAR